MTSFINFSAKHSFKSFHTTTNRNNLGQYDDNYMSLFHLESICFWIILQHSELNPFMAVQGNTMNCSSIGYFQEKAQQ